MSQLSDGGIRRGRLDPLTRSSPSLGGTSLAHKEPPNPLLAGPRLRPQKHTNRSGPSTSTTHGSRDLLFGGTSSSLNGGLQGSRSRTEYEELHLRLQQTTKKIEANQRRQQELLADRLQHSRQLAQEIKPPRGPPPMIRKSPSAPIEQSKSSSFASMKFKAFDQDPAAQLLDWMADIMQRKPSTRYLAPLTQASQGNLVQSKGNRRKNNPMSAGSSPRRRARSGTEADDDEVDEELAAQAEMNAIADDALADFQPEAFDSAALFSAAAQEDGEWLELSPPRDGWKEEHLNILRGGCLKTSSPSKPSSRSASKQSSRAGSKRGSRTTSKQSAQEPLLSGTATTQLEFTPVQTPAATPSAGTRGGQSLLRAVTPKPLPNLHVRAVQAFRRLEVDAEIPVDRLPTALTIIGHPVVKEDILKEIVEQDFDGVSFLGKDEYLDAVHKYEEKYLAHMKTLFDAEDKDGNGYLSLAEITRVLRNLGISPVLDVVKELVREVVGTSHSQTRIELEHFIAITDIIRDRAGFTLSETGEFTKVFTRYDRDSDEKLTPQELKWALGWMGFATSASIAQSLFDRADKDCSGLIDFAEFLNLMRMHREHEVDNVMRAFSRQDKGFTGTVAPEDLPKVFTQMGYAARPFVLGECAKKISVDKPALMFEDLYVLLDEFRKAEGFTTAEMDEIADVFKRFDALDSGTVGGIHLGAAINWLGYPHTLEQVHEILEEFDLDDNGALNLSEFVKLIRHYKVMLVKTARTEFNKGDINKDGTLNAKELRPVLLALGFAPDDEEVQKIILTGCGPDQEVDFWELVDLVESFRKEERDRLRANEGFHDGEVRRLRRRFNRYDAALDGHLNGFVAHKQLANLLEDILPGVRENIETHKKAKALIDLGDRDKDGCINFQDFLRMMRSVQDEAEAHQFEHERGVAQDCRFTRDEVKEFRKVFKMFDSDASGQISFEELEAMFDGIVPLGSQATKQLRGALASVDNDGNRNLDFAEFLRMMRKLQDENWNNINSAAAEIAEQQQDEDGADQEEQEPFGHTVSDSSASAAWNTLAMHTATEDSGENMIAQGEPTMIKISDKNLYLTVSGGAMDGNYLRLHGDLTGAAATAHSKFVFERIAGNTYIIKAFDADLYLSAVGGSYDGNYIRLHGDRDFAITHPSSQFVFITTSGNQYRVLASDAELHWNAADDQLRCGSEEGHYVRLHGDIVYAETHPHTQFVLEVLPEMVD